MRRGGQIRLTLLINAYKNENLTRVERQKTPHGGVGQHMQGSFLSTTKIEIIGQTDGYIPISKYNLSTKHPIKYWFVSVFILKLTMRPITFFHWIKQDIHWKKRTISIRFYAKNNFQFYFRSGQWTILSIARYWGPFFINSETSKSKLSH